MREVHDALPGFVHVDFPAFHDMDVFSRNCLNVDNDECFELADGCVVDCDAGLTVVFELHYSIVLRPYFYVAKE